MDLTQVPELVTNADIDISKAVIIDAHLLKTYRACQQKFNLFELLHIVGRSRKAAPSFGIAMHEGIEHFRKAKMAGKKYTEAYKIGAEALLAAYKKFMPKESMMEVMQDDRRSPKNALRIFTGYCEHYEPVALKFLYVESPFALYLGPVETINGPKDVVYVGIIDGVFDMGGQIYVNDLKSTAWTISEHYLEGFKMDQGLLGYMVAARELLNVDTHQAIVHAMWIQAEAKDPKRAKKLDEYFHTKELYWEDSQITEWHQNVLNTVAEIEMRKADGKWIMDFGQNCGAFGGCDYRAICSAPPAIRAQLIKMDYDFGMWSPLEDERMQKLDASSASM
jgi:hypothetical protein